MNILTLSIKQKYFDEILAGKKTHEYREIRPTNAKKYIIISVAVKNIRLMQNYPKKVKKN